MAENSVTAYTQDVKDFLEFTDMPVENITHKEVVAYLNEVADLGLQSSSLARKRASLHQFFAYLVDTDHPTAMDFDKVPKIKVGKQLPDVLDVDTMLGFWMACLWKAVWTTAIN